MKQLKGFTLIELIIVIALIGILATFVVANFLGVKQRARDTQRKSDLRQVQSAFELYRTDVGTYPASLPACGAALTSGTNTYMQKFPCDPSSASAYGYTIAGSVYYLRACLENANDSQKDSVQNNPNPPSACAASTVSFTVTNP